jgi:hypothetical protein
MTSIYRCVAHNMPSNWKFINYCKTLNVQPQPSTLHPPKHRSSHSFFGARDFGCTISLKHFLKVWAPWGMQMLSQFVCSSMCTKANRKQWNTMHDPPCVFAHLVRVTLSCRDSQLFILCARKMKNWEFPSRQTHAKKNMLIWFAWLCRVGIRNCSFYVHVK